MTNKHLIPLAVGILIIGGASFYGGTIYAKSSASMRGGRQTGGANGGAFAFRGAQASAGGQNRGNLVFAGGFTAGEIISKDDKSLTVKLQDGGSKIVFFSTSTKVSKTSEGDMGDVTQGNNVVVTGTSNQDGSVTANMIQIRPAGDMGMMPRMGGNGGSRPQGNAQQTPPGDVMTQPVEVRVGN